MRREVQQLGVEPALGLPLRAVSTEITMSPSSVGHRGGGGLALREREHVGRLVLAALVAVERVDRRVVGEAQRDVEVAAALAQRGAP